MITSIVENGFGNGYKQGFLGPFGICKFLMDWIFPQEINKIA
jgi:hypothetical protein